VASDYEWNVTRGATGGLFYLITPAARAPSRLAEVGAETVVCKFVTPRHAPALFAEYLVELEPGGGTQWPVAGGFEHFVFVLEGTVKTLVDGLPRTMTPGTFIYLPDDQALVLDNDSDGLCRVIWISAVTNRCPASVVPLRCSTTRPSSPRRSGPAGCGAASCCPPTTPAVTSP